MCKNILEDDFIYTKDEFKTIVKCLDEHIDVTIELKEDCEKKLLKEDSKFGCECFSKVINSCDKEISALKKLRNNIKKSIMED